MGSGSTGVAALEEGFNFVGIEREAEYAAVAKKRLKHKERNMASMLFTRKPTKEEVSAFLAIVKDEDGGDGKRG